MKTTSSGLSLLVNKHQTAKDRKDTQTSESELHILRVWGLYFFESPYFSGVIDDSCVTSTLLQTSITKKGKSTMTNFVKLWHTVIAKLCLNFDLKNF